jgi:hypothetical protein
LECIQHNIKQLHAICYLNLDLHQVVMDISSHTPMDTRRRVKVYQLDEEQQWADKGTGHVSITYVEVRFLSINSLLDLSSYLKQVVIECNKFHQLLIPSPIAICFIYY